MNKLRLDALSLILTLMMLIGTIAVFNAHAQPLFNPWQGYVKPSFPDYAPSGVPDFDEKQDQWGPAPNFYTWCGPVAVASSLWWLDSEYESLFNPHPQAPPTISDHFPLVTSYNPAWDDHDPQNVDPLVRNLAFLMDTDGQRSADGHVGTRWPDLETGIELYLAQQGLTKYFEVHNSSFPDFGWVSNEVLICQDVELFLEFKQWTGGTWTNLTQIPSFESGHFVTCAGVNTTTGQVLISDPYQDAYEAGLAPGLSPVGHPAGHVTTVHNNASYVSQDAYNMTIYAVMPPNPPVPGYPPIVWELQGYLQTLGLDPSCHAFIRAAVATSPKEVQEWKGYVKPSFADYALSGVPDFDEKQDQWGPGPGQYTWCVPVAVANSLWWLDSEYESIMFDSPVPPPTISDHFPLVTSYNVAWDDHDPQNVDPLVRDLAFLMDTDGQRSGDGHVGTRWADVQNGINQYLAKQGVAAMFDVHNASFPDFAWIENETRTCQDVELFLEFWQWTGSSWTNLTITNPSLELGHCVTSAGINSTTSQVLISDPYEDAFEAGIISDGRSPVPHIYPHTSAVHNDTQYVSQDAYNVTPYPPVPPPPPGYPVTVYELQGYLQTLGFDPSYHTFIKGAVATSPIGFHDVAVINHTSAKTIIGQGYCGNLTATAQNQGNFPENFNVTVYANATSIDTLSFSLAIGDNASQGLMWNSTGFAYGNYTLLGAADVVPGDVNASNNNCTCSVPVHVGVPGDISGPTMGVYDKTVNMRDISYMILLFNTKPTSPNWNPNADVNNDGIVNMRDISIAIINFNRHE